MDRLGWIYSYWSFPVLPIAFLRRRRVIIHHDSSKKKKERERGRESGGELLNKAEDIGNFFDSLSCHPSSTASPLLSVQP